MKKGFPRRPPASRPPIPSGNAHPTPGLTVCPAPSTSWAWLQGLSPALGCSSLALGAVNHEAATPLITGSLALCSASAPSPSGPSPRPTDLPTSETLLREAFPPPWPPKRARL